MNKNCLILFTILLMSMYNVNGLPYFTGECGQNGSLLKVYANPTTCIVNGQNYMVELSNGTIGTMYCTEDINPASNICGYYSTSSCGSIYGAAWHLNVGIATDCATKYYTDRIDVFCNNSNVITNWSFYDRYFIQNVTDINANYRVYWFTNFHNYNSTAYTNNSRLANVVRWTDSDSPNRVVGITANTSMPKSANTYNMTQILSLKWSGWTGTSSTDFDYGAGAGDSGGFALFRESESVKGNYTYVVTKCIDRNNSQSGDVIFTQPLTSFLLNTSYGDPIDNRGTAVYINQTALSKCKIITINNPTDSNFTDFPVNINITYDSDMQADFDDVRFFTGNCYDYTDNITLYAELEDKTNSESAYIWLKTNLSTGDNNISMYYGNSTATHGWDYNGNVWDSNYELVMHMTDLNDSTWHKTVFTEINTTIANDNSMWGKSREIINATIKSLSKNSYLNFNNESLTAEVWGYNYDDNEKNQQFIGGYNQEPSAYWVLTEGFYDDMQFCQYNTSGSTICANMASGYSKNNWHYTVGISDSENSSIYANMAAPVTTTTPRLKSTSILTQIFIGSNSVGGSVVNGSIDEIRVSRGVRSVAWLNQTYLLLTNNLDYISFSEEYDAEGILIWYSNNYTNSTLAGANITHNLLWNTTGILDKYIFSFCNGFWNGTACNDVAGNTSVNILNDTFLELDDDTYGAATAVLCYVDDPIDGGTSYGDCAQRWNLSSIPSTATLNDVQMCFTHERAKNVDATDIISFWGIAKNATWTASTINFHNSSMGFDNFQNISGSAMSAYAVGVRECFNVTTWFASQFAGGNYSISFDMYLENDLDDSADDYFAMDSKEAAVVANRPSLNVTYTMPSTSGWVNDSAVAFGGTYNWTNVSKIVNATVGLTIAWCVFANTTTGETNNSCITPFTYNLTSATDCYGAPVEDCTVGENTVYTMPYNGTYYLNDSNINGVIIVNGNNATIDCNSSTIIGINKSASSFINVTAKNLLTVKNCVLNNFNRPIRIAISNNSIIENNVINYNSSINYFTGILLDDNSGAGRNIIIRNNTILSTVANVIINGIYVHGSISYPWTNITIKNNYINISSNGGDYWAIACEECTNSTINNNIAYYYEGYGIYINGDANIINNTIKANWGAIAVTAENMINITQNNILMPEIYDSWCEIGFSSGNAIANIFNNTYYNSTNISICLGLNENVTVSENTENIFTAYLASSNVTFNYSGYKDFIINNMTLNIINQSDKYPYDDVQNVSTDTVIYTDFDNLTITLSNQSIVIGNFFTSSSIYSSTFSCDEPGWCYNVTMYGGNLTMNVTSSENSPVLFLPFDIGSNNMANNTACGIDLTGTQSTGTCYGKNGDISINETGAHQNYGKGIYLNGTNDYIIIPNSSSLNIMTQGKSLTIEFWIKSLDGGESTVPRILTKIESGNLTNNNYGIAIDTANNYIWLQVYDGTTKVNNRWTGLLVNDTWIHFSAQYNTADNSMKMYKNGIDQGSGTAGTITLANTIQGDNLLIGLRGDSLGDYRGYIDDLLIYDYLIDNDTVFKHYQQGVYAITGKYIFNVSSNITYNRYNSTADISLNQSDQTIKLDGHDIVSQNNAVPDTTNRNYTFSFSSDNASRTFMLDTYTITTWYNATADNIAPENITNLQALQITTSSIYMTWINPSDPDYDHAEIYQDGVFVANSSNTYYNATGLTESTQYNFTLIPVDYWLNKGNNATISNTTSTEGVFSLVVNVSYDNANISSYTTSDTVMNFSLATDPTDYTYWFSFRVSNVSGQNITFNILNANLTTLLSRNSANNQIYYTCDEITWIRPDERYYAIPIYQFNISFAENCSEALITTQIPFSYEDMMTYINNITSGYTSVANQTTIGLSPEGRNITRIIITNFTVSTASQKIIYIDARQHAGEVVGDQMIRGLINFLVSSDYDAIIMRNRYRFYIVPMSNPDGVYKGYSRSTGDGYEMNDKWHPDNTDSNETIILRTDILDVNSTIGIDLWLDWHSQITSDDANFLYTYTSAASDAFFANVSKWTLFNDESRSGASSCTAGMCTARGFGTNRGLFVFTIEPNPHNEYWTLENMQETGKNMTYAIDEYFKSTSCIYSGTGNWIITKHCDIINSVYNVSGIINISTTGWLNISGNSIINATNIIWYPADAEEPFRMRWNASAKIRWS